MSRGSDGVDMDDDGLGDTSFGSEFDNCPWSLRRVDSSDSMGDLLLDIPVTPRGADDSFRIIGWTPSLPDPRQPKPAPFPDAQQMLLSEALVAPLRAHPHFAKAVELIMATTDALGAILYLWYPHRQLLVHHTEENLLRYAPRITAALDTKLAALRATLPVPAQKQFLLLSDRPTFDSWGCWSVRDVSDCCGPNPIAAGAGDFPGLDCGELDMVDMLLARESRPLGRQLGAAPGIAPPFLASVNSCPAVATAAAGQAGTGAAADRHPAKRRTPVDAARSRASNRAVPARAATGRSRSRFYTVLQAENTAP
jgi:hypothetical protein